jgi:hypothetical protein
MSRNLVIPGVAAVLAFVAALWVVFQTDPIVDRVSVAWLPGLEGPIAIVGFGMAAAVPVFLVAALVTRIGIWLRARAGAS